MRRQAAAVLLALAAGAAAGAEPPALLLVGDSTLAPETGYGDELCRRFAPTLACLNLARGGRSTLSYRAEGLWDRVIARLRAGEPGVPRTVLIQFGHNDQPGKPGRSTDLATEFPANLKRFVAEVRAAGGQPLLVTPLTRRSFKDGRLVHDLRPWADATLAVARELEVSVVDFNAISAEAVQALGQEGADRLAMAPPGAPGFDRTHVGPEGACLFAGLMADALRRRVPALVPYLKADVRCAAPALAPLPNRATYDQPGWATGTLGGRGGRVVRVTTLAAKGPGSLRAALETKGPRLVVFEVGGVIDLAGETITLREPFVTVGGQTAPRPGITLIRGELNVATHDVILQHLMFRPGAWGRAFRSGNDQDGLSTQGGAHHVIVDHCSFSWGTDENLSIGGPRFEGRQATSHNVTYSHNLVYEGLSMSVHPKGEHSKGTLVHDNASGVLLLGNVYASNRERNALFKGGVHAAMVNNLIYNPGARAVHYNLVAHEWDGQTFETGQLALVGNVLRHGPDTKPGVPLFALGGAGDVQLHLHDNVAVDTEGRPVPQTARYTTAGARILPADTPYLPPRLRAVPAEKLEDLLLPAVGARPWDRDPVDFKLLSDIAEGRGAIVDRESDSSGYPKHAPTRRPFDDAAWDLRDLSPAAGWDSLFAAPRR